MAYVFNSEGAPRVDAALLVVEEGRTRCEDVTRAAELLSGTHLIGAVLNKSAELKLPADKEYRLIDPPNRRLERRDR